MALPTYDYHCAKCKNTYETRESFSAPTTHRCQECGKGTAKRVLTAPRIVFKGSGWYATDSRSKTVATTEPSESKGGDGGSSSESGGESKSADGKAGDSKPAKTEPKAVTSSSESGAAST